MNYQSMFVIETKDSKCIAITNATNFKVNDKLELVLFKCGFRNVAMYDLSSIKSINKVESVKEFEDYRCAIQKGLI